MPTRFPPVGSPPRRPGSKGRGHSHKPHLLDESLTRLEEEFPDRFIRLHRGVLIARDAIAGFQREREGEDGEGEHWIAVVRGTNEHLPVSRRQWPTVKAFAKRA